MKRKPTPIKQVRKLVMACENYGIETFCFFILGLPGETKLAALKTIAYALRLDSTFVQFTIATPYLGTDLRKWAENKGYLENTSLKSLSSFKATMRNEYMTTAEIQWLWRLAYAAWVLKPTNLMKRGLKRPG
jgi:magnesium-protoporphyrin IX monomethyl ester (oxidative) cyclase